MCITIMNRLVYCKMFLAVFCMFSTIENMQAQEIQVEPIHRTSVNPIQYELFVYLSGNKMDRGNLWTANNGTYTDDLDLYGTKLETGIGAEFFKTDLNQLRLGSFLGYKRSVYSYERDSFNNSGVYSHFLTMDLNVGLSYFGLGAKTDLFLNSRINNHDHFSYEGLYSDCFNSMNLSLYASLFIRFSKFKLEAKFGSYVIPELNPKKISYHNITKTYVEGLYIEVKLLFRIFTSGKVYEAPYII